MRSISVAGIQGVQATGEEESVFVEAIVEVVVYQLSQLRIHR